MTCLMPYIVDLLGATAPILDEYPGVQSTFPCIVYSEVDNASAIVLSGEERLSDIIIQLDCYSKGEDRENVELLSKTVSDKMLETGFTRSSGPSGTNSDGIFYRTMRFTGRLNEKTHYIHK